MGRTQRMDRESGKQGPWEEHAARAVEVAAKRGGVKQLGITVGAPCTALRRRNDNKEMKGEGQQPTWRGKYIQGNGEKVQTDRSLPPLSLSHAYELLL